MTLIANADMDYEEHGVLVRALPMATGGRLARMTCQAWRAWRMAVYEDADLYHFHDPELIPAGVALRLRGKPVIYDVHESVSKQILSKRWIPKVLRRITAGLYRLVEKSMGPTMTAIVAATPGVASYFSDKKTTVIQNFPSISDLRSDDSMTANDREPFAIYVGGITAGRGAREMVQAMALLPESCELRLEMGGPVIPPALQDELLALRGANHTTMLGMLTQGQVAEKLSGASIGLCVLHPAPNYMDSYPTKLFEYMAAGLPVVASNFPFWRQFVEGVGSGVMVDPLNPQSIADGILEIINDPARAREMGAAGERAVREHYNWDAEAVKLIRLTETILQK